MAAGLSGCADAKRAATAGHGTTTRYDPSLHDRLPDAIQERGLLRIGTDASYAPMSSFGPDGRTIIGVEPDLGAAIGHILGLRVTFVNTDFTDVLPHVADGQLDLAMSALTDTPSRVRRVDFIDYFRAGTTIVVQTGNPAAVSGLQDLCGKVAAVERGTTQVALLHRAQSHCGQHPIRVRAYDTNSDALVQLRTGRAAAVLNDFPPAEYLINDPRTRSQYTLASTTQYEPGLYGIAVAKQSTGLRDAVYGACRALMKSGGYGAVLKRWHVGDGAINRISVNSDR